MLANRENVYNANIPEAVFPALDAGKFKIVEYITNGNNTRLPATVDELYDWSHFSNHEFIVGMDYDRILKGEILPNPGIPSGAVIDKNFKWHHWGSGINIEKNAAFWNELLDILDE